MRPVRDGQLVAMYRSLLSKSELESAAKFRFVTDRERFITTRALIRTVLSRYIDKDPRDWQFGATAHGRPFVLCEGKLGLPLEFNLSHTDDLIIVAIGTGRRLGVDVESLVRPAPLNVAPRWFSPAENAGMDGLPAAARSRRFFELWTLKESFVKAHGHGLGLPLEQFEFDLDQAGEIGFKPMVQAITDGESAAFWQFLLPENHLGALCSIDSRTAIVPQLNATHIVPGVGEETLMLGLLRRSPSGLAPVAHT